jgi:hypothetical protein
MKGKVHNDSKGAAMPATDDVGPHPMAQCYGKLAYSSFRI